MKRVVLFLLGIIPFMLSAQNECVYFEEMVTLQIEKTDLNTVESDFGPAFVGDELYFSAYTDEELEKLAKGKSKKINYDAFTSKIDEKGNVLGERGVRLTEQSEGYHVGPVAYCEKTGEIFVTISNFENAKARTSNRAYQTLDVKLKILIGEKVDGKWQKTGELPFNSPDYSVGHPTVTSGGDTLYFASDIPGKGFGGTDLYMTVRKDGVWGDMVNLGAKINSAGNDMFPFIYKDKMLIFASNGRKEAEDLDVYHVGMFGDKMTAITEVEQLNSDSDDFGFVIHPKEEVGFFTSNRTGGEGSDDIYKVLIEEKPVQLELIVKDRATDEQIRNAKIVFEDELLTIDGLVFKKELERGKSYAVKTDMDGYMNESKTITTKGIQGSIVKETLWIEKVKIRKPIVMENIYYDFDKWNILAESEVELDKLVKIMKDNPDWKVELGSHTDCRGSNWYNNKLSQKRSESAVAYIVKGGIEKDRIVAKGYGEKELVNKCSDGVPCSAADHRMNRRTEFKILEMD